MLTKNQVKYIQSLSQKKLRDQESVFIAEGPKIIDELLTMHHLQPVAVYGTSDWWQLRPDIHQQSWANEISQPELERISFLITPHQVLGVFKKPDQYPVTGKWILLLDGIQDPGNLGTLIRIADWFGIGHLICSEDSADAYNPKVIQSSMSSIGRVGILYTNLTEYVKADKKRNYYAAVLNGKAIGSVRAEGNAALVIGNESKGIRPELMQELRHFVTIPRLGTAESLNASVAAGIILSHLVK